jgi:hypothetical protein
MVELRSTKNPPLTLETFFKLSPIRPCLFAYVTITQSCKNVQSAILDFHAHARKDLSAVVKFYNIDRIFLCSDLTIPENIHTWCTYIPDVHTYLMYIHTWCIYIPHVHTYLMYIHTSCTFIHTYALVCQATKIASKAKAGKDLIVCFTS